MMNNKDMYSPINLLFYNPAEWLSSSIGGGWWIESGCYYWMLRLKSVPSGWLDRNPTGSKVKYGKVIMKEAFAFIIHSITVLLRGPPNPLL